MDGLKIHRDPRVHIECGALFSADQNAHIFDDGELEITKF
jgi:hypothetical protein